MAALTDTELERYCQCRAMNGAPSDLTPGRSYAMSLGYALGRIGMVGATQASILSEKIARNREAVVARLTELGGPADDIFGGI
jgi:hypothetical protein